MTPPVRHTEPPRWPAVEQAPHEVALLADGVRWTWQELYHQVQRRAQELPRAPFRRFHSHNDVPMLVDLLACQEVGVIPILLQPRLPAARARRLYEETCEHLAAVEHSQHEGLADIVFTSGSTGQPKAVAHDRLAQATSAQSANTRTPFGPGDRWLLSLSLCHVGGLGILERARQSGGAIVIPPSKSAWFSSSLAFGVTHLSVVRAQLHELILATPGPRAASHFRAILVGGGPCPTAVFQRAMALGLPVAQTWGSTETTAQVATSQIGAPETAGTALPGREVRRAESGELRVGGAGLARGYVTRAGIELPLDAEGFYPTGDLGTVDSDGKIRILGRQDSMFISGGENIHPEEIERWLLEHPSVTDALVVPVAHHKYGQRPVAFLRCRTDVSPQQLQQLLEDKVPRFLFPDVYFPWPEEEPTIKPSRARLRQIAAQWQSSRRGG